MARKQKETKRSRERRKRNEKKIGKEKAASKRANGERQRKVSRADKNEKDIGNLLKQTIRTESTEERRHQAEEKLTTALNHGLTEQTRKGYSGYVKKFETFAEGIRSQSEKPPSRPEIPSVAFSPDGHKIVSGSWDKTVRVWNAETGEPLGPALEGHTNAVLSVAFSPDSHRIVSGDIDRKLQISNSAAGGSLRITYQQHRLDHDGWLVGPNDKHLIWVPENFRTGL
ncbi:SubName: Full=Unplaced genomic scaffold GYMLUscaffold_38, whole genome shotgun sequence {ECO:0000313/EMBL:KIK58313.1}; Flags: Fragment, partial [Serendipita indica DSM 11827]